MRIFISWSGESSNAVATALQQLLQEVGCGFEPWLSSKGIAAGSAWRREIFTALEDARFGVSCVSRSNLRSAWMQFECGAMSISVPEGRICPYLIDLGAAELAGGPLEPYQSCQATEAGTWTLLLALNHQLAKPRREHLLRRSFQKHFPALQKVLDTTVTELAPLDAADYNRLDASGLSSLLTLHFRATASKLQSVMIDALSDAKGKVDRINFELVHLAARNQLREGRLLLAPFHNHAAGNIKAFLDSELPVADLEGRLADFLRLAERCTDGGQVLSLLDHVIQEEQTELKDRLQTRLQERATRRAKSD